MIFSPFFLFALDIFSSPKTIFFLPPGFCFLLNFKSSLLDWSYVGEKFSFARLMSFSVYLLFWMYPITEGKKNEKKKWIKKNPYPSFRFNFERTIYLQLVGKSILLFIYLLKLIPNLKSGIQSEFFFLCIFLSTSFFIISSKKIYPNKKLHNAFLDSNMNS